MKNQKLSICGLDKTMKSYGFDAASETVSEQRTREAEQQLARSDLKVFPIVMDIYGDRNGALGMHRHNSPFAAMQRSQTLRAPPEGMHHRPSGTRRP